MVIMEGNDMHGIDTHSQANVARMEHQILDHVKQALRVTLGWKVPDSGLSRKVSSVRFTFQSFQRHLERLLDLEEQDGYMVLVAELKPNMFSRVERLEHDHIVFRNALHNLMPEVEAVSEYQSEEFEEVCGEIHALLEKLDRHDEEEIDLLQESLLMDEGGEG